MPVCVLVVKSWPVAHFRASAALIIPENFRDCCYADGRKIIPL